MKLLGNIFIVIGVLLFLPIITIGWGIAFVALGALLRIAAALSARKS